MNDVSRRFTVWLSGYYEDFQSMRVISEGEDYATTDFFTNRRDSHAGNTMAAQALNNPRFTFDYLTRSFANKAPIPLIGSAAQSEAASLHNEGPSQWLTFDPNRTGAAFYEGRATLTYPDTLEGPIIPASHRAGVHRTDIGRVKETPIQPTGEQVS